MSRSRRRWITVLGAGGVLCSAVAIGAVSFLRWMGTEEGQAWLASQVASVASDQLEEGSVEIGVLHTDFYSYLELESLEVRERDGEPLIGVDRVMVRLEPARLWDQQIWISSLELQAPTLDLVRDSNGGLNLLEILPDPGGEDSLLSRQLADWTLQVDALEVSQARVMFRDERESSAVPALSFLVDSLSLGFERDEEAVVLVGLNLDLAVDQPVQEDVSVQASLTYDGSGVDLPVLSVGVSDLELRLHGHVSRLFTDPYLDLEITRLGVGPEFPAKLMGEDVLNGAVAVDGRIQGPGSALSTVLSVFLPKGELDLEVQANLDADYPSWALVVESRGLDPSALSPLLPVSADLSGAIKASGNGLNPWTDMRAVWSLEGDAIQVEGELFEGVQARGGLEDGRLWVDESSVRHSLANAEIGASLDLNTLDLVAEARIGIPSLEAVPAIDGIPPVSGSVVVAGSLESRLGEEALSATLSGELEGDSWAMDGLSIGKVRVPLEGQVALDSISLNGTAHVEGVSRDEVDVSLVRLPFWRLDWATETGAVLSSRLSLEQVSLGSDAVRVGGIDGVLQGVLEPGAQLGLGAELQVRDVALGPAGYRAEGGAIQATLDGDQVRLAFDLSRRARPFFQGEVEGDLFRQEWTVDQLVLAPKTDRPLYGVRPVRLRLADGGIRDLDFSLKGEDGFIEIQGDWLEIHQAQSDLSVAIEELDLPYVLDVVGLYDPSLVEDIDTSQVMGRFSMKGSARDGEDGMVVLGKGRLKGLVWEDRVNVPLVEIEAEGLLSKPWIRVTANDDEGTLFELDARVPLDAGVGSLGVDCAQELSLDGVWGLSDDSRMKTVIPLLGPIPEGRLGASMSFHGEACNPDFVLLATGDLRVGEGKERLRYDLDLVRNGGVLEVEGSLEEGLATRVEINGEIETGIGDVLGWVFQGAEQPDLSSIETWVHGVSIGVIPINLPVDSLARYLPVPGGIHGKLTGGLSVIGDTMEPQIQAGLLLVDGRVGASSVPIAKFGLMPEPGGYQVDLSLDTDDGHGLAARGHVPFALDLRRGVDQDLSRDGLDLRVSGPGLPMAMMVGVVDDVTEADGTLVLDGEIQGSVLNPKPRLTFKTREASFAYSVTGVRYSRLDLFGNLAGDQFFFHSLRLDSEPLWSRIQARTGTLRLAKEPGGGTRPGQATLDGLELDQVRMFLEAESFWLSNIPMASLQLDGNIEITGRTPGLKFRGDAKLLDSRMSFDESWFTEEKGLELDPSIVLHRASSGALANRDERAPDFWEPFDMEFVVDLDRQLRLVAHVPMEYGMGRQLAALSTVSTDVELDGQDVKVIWRDGEPTIVGTVEVYDGSMYMLGRQFKVGAGEVSWIGGDFLDPILDLQATKATRGYGEVNTQITGSLENMDVSFDSEDYPDQTDVLSILILGKPASELAGSEAQVGAQMLGAALAMAAGRQFSRAVGSSLMGQVELDQDALKVGLSLGEKAFVELQRRSLAEPDENILEIRLEWLIMRRMYFELVSGDRGQGSADLYRRWSF